MFTQCPECRTVFEIAPADLAVAAGMVRCGECSRTFNALKSLAETPLEFETGDAPSATGTPADAEPSAPVTPAAAETTAQSVAGPGDDEPGPGEDEREGGAVAAVIAAAAALAAQPAQQPDSGDETTDSPDEEDEPDDVEAGDDEPDDVEAGDDETATIADDEEVEAAAAAVADEPEEVDDGGDEIVLDEFYEPSGSDDEEPIDDEEDWDSDLGAIDELSEEAALAQPVDESALFSLPVPELHASGIVPATSVPEKLEGGEAALDPFAQDAHEAGHAAVAGAAEVAAVTHAAAPLLRDNDAVDAEDARDLSDYLRAPRPGRLAAAVWTGGSALLALLLLAQIVHHNRGDLAIHQRFGPAIRSLYDTFGLQVRPNWRIDDYKIVGQARLIEMPATDGDQPPGALRFVAIIANRSDRPQPPPMVRITLRDRWGDPKGVRNFAPPEYLTDRAMVEQLLEPGQRLRVVLNLLDPGVEVDGFDFDMCLPDMQGKLRCSSEPAG